MSETTSPSQLTATDLAELLSHGTGQDSGTLERFAAFARSDPLLGPLYEELEAIASDYGESNPAAFSAALWFNEMVDLLVEAEGWEHPDEVLRSHESMYDEYLDILIRIVAARAKRTKAPKTLLAIKKKLERAHRAFKRRLADAERR